MLRVVENESGAVAICVGERRGLVFYVTGVAKPEPCVDLFCMPVAFFAKKYKASNACPLKSLAQTFRSAGLPITAAAGLQLQFVAALKRPDAPEIVLNTGERRRQPKLSKGRKPKNFRRGGVFSTTADVYLQQQEANVGLASILKREHAMSTKPAKPEATKATKPAKAEATKPAKPEATKATKSAKAEATKPAKPEATKATKATKPAKAEGESGRRGRVRSTEVLEQRVVAAEGKKPREGFYTELREAAKRPIAIKSLIERLQERYPDSAEQKPHEKVAAKVFDAYKRMGHLVAA